METPMFLMTSLSLGAHIGLAKKFVQDFLHTGMANSHELFDQPNTWGPTLLLVSLFFLVPFQNNESERWRTGGIGEKRDPC